MAKFEKGRAKTGGRKAGTPNKSTKFGVDFVQSFLDEYRDTGKMSEDWDNLESKDRLAIAEKMMAYVMPKRAAVDANVEVQSKKTIEDTLIALAEEQR